MNNKVILYIAGAIIIFVLYIYILITFNAENRYDELISIKLEDINNGINSLNYNNNSNGYYESIVSFTEIKQDCMMVINIISLKKPSDIELAVGDFLGYIHNYIDDITFDNTSPDVINTIIKELQEVGEVFDRVSCSGYDNYQEHIKELYNEVNINAKKYPNNTIINKYLNRKTY